MKQARIKWTALLCALLAAVFVCVFFADRFQTANGAIKITEGTIPTEVGDLTYKLYTPKGAKDAPGVLLLHGYQNDRETCAAYAIELARRGVVVLAQVLQGLRTAAMSTIWSRSITGRTASKTGRSVRSAAPSAIVF